MGEDIKALIKDINDAIEKAGLKYVDTVGVLELIKFDICQEAKEDVPTRNKMEKENLT